MRKTTEDAVRSADRQRQPSDEEIERIWSRVRDEPRAGASERAEVIELSTRARVERRPSRVGWLVGAAAAVVAAVAVFGAPWADDSVVVNNVASDGPVVESPRPATPFPVLQVCRGSVADLARAIEAWDTLSDWAASGDGEPDVGRLAVAALADVADLDPQASETATTVEEALADRLAQGGLLGADHAAHEAAVRLGIDQINESITDLDPAGECDLAPLAAALSE